MRWAAGSTVGEVFGDCMCRVVSRSFRNILGENGCGVLGIIIKHLFASSARRESSVCRAGSVGNVG